jgi:uncharacterized protein with NRDE domain
MCLIALAWRGSPDFRLVVVANRDEFHMRATAPVSFWEDAPQLLAGRDLEAGGTWLGVTRQGRFAAITNVREPGVEPPTAAPSRGALVRDFLLGEASPADYAAEVHGAGPSYAGFNLLVGDREALWYASNRADAPLQVEEGVHGLSNAGLNTPWPKVEGAKEELADWLSRGGLSVEELFVLLGDREVPADDALPDTGVGIDLERQLGSRFIVGAMYGTRSSTVLSVDVQDQVTLVECSFDGEGDAVGNRGYAFNLE